MTWDDGSRSPAVLAVIPARGGSKGIPGKNMKRLGGLTLVGRATQLAVSLNWIDQVIVSTDDPEIAAEVARQGGDVPFLRPAALADDVASSDDMWRHAWHAAEDHYGQQFDVSLLLEPTSPLRQPADLTATMAALFGGAYHGAATVSPTPAHYAPQKTLTVNEGRVGFLLEEGARTARRQDVPQLYHRNGLCYALHRAPFLDGAPIFDDACAAVIVERPVANIDEPFELELAEWLLERQGRVVPDLPLSETALAHWFAPVFMSAGGCQRRHGHLHAHLTTQQIEQKKHAVLIRRRVEYTDMIRHRTFGDADFVTFLKTGTFAENDISARILVTANIVDNIVGHGCGLPAVADQLAHTHGRVERPPPRALGIHPHEQVTGKERFLHAVRFAGVAPTFDIAGQIDVESLAQNVRQRLELTVGVGFDDEPAFRIIHDGVSPAGVWLT